MAWVGVSDDLQTDRQTDTWCIELDADGQPSTTEKPRQSSLPPTHITVASKPDLELDGLLQSLETPLALDLLIPGEGEKVGEGLIRFGPLDVLGVVVFVLAAEVGDVNIVVVVLVVELVAGGGGSDHARRTHAGGQNRTYGSSSDSCIKSSSDMVAGMRCGAAAAAECLVDGYSLARMDAER
jgi:hypothetical protein